MTMIKDPVFGNAARVGEDNRLQVWAVAEPSAAARSHDGDAYISSVAQGGVRTLTLATVQTYALLALKNTSPDKLIAIDQIIVSLGAAGGIIFLTKNPTEGTLANNTAITPSNRNFASTNIAEAEANVWDEVGTAGITGFTVGEEFESEVLPAGVSQLAVDGALHLGQGNILLLSIENPTGGAIEAAASIRYHFEPVESRV